MFATIFNLLINLLATIVQIICTPINTIITNTLPSVSSWITNASNGLNTIVGYMRWAIGILPPIVIEMISFILLVEVAKHTIFKSTHVLSKIWTIIQKIKFW